MPFWTLDIMLLKMVWIKSGHLAMLEECGGGLL